MKKLLIVVMYCWVTTTVAQIHISENEIPKELKLDGKKHYYNSWTWRTTGIVPPNELHVGVISATRYGIKKNLELEVQLFLFPFAPNIALKKRWFKGQQLNNRWSFASRHGMYYPTLGFHFLKSTGYKDILTDTVKIPQILAFKNELIVSYILNPNCDANKPKTILTGRLGVDFAFKNGTSSLPKMTFFTLYYRSSIAHGNYLPYIGLQLDANILGKEKFNFTISSDYFRVNLGSNTAFEHTALAHCFFNSRFSASAGVVFHQGNNEIEKDTNIIPLVNLIYKFNHQQRLQQGLFKKGTL